MSDTPIPTPKPKNLWPSSSAPTKVFDFDNDSADQPADQRRVDSLEADIKEMKALMAEQVATQAACPTSPDAQPPRGAPRREEEEEEEKQIWPST